MSGDERQEDIRELREIFANYAEISVDNEEKRRVENIQVLVALGILGGFVSFYVQGSIRDTTIELLVWVVITTSALFLLEKIIVPPMLLWSESDRLERVDNQWVYAVYPAIVVLSLFAGGLIIIERYGLLSYMSNYVDINEIFSVLAAVVALVTVVIQYKNSSGYAKERKDRKQRFQYATSNLRTSEIIWDIVNNSEALGDNAKNIDREVEINGKYADIVSEDIDGNIVITEVKTQAADLAAASYLAELVKEYKDNNPEESVRGVLLAPAISPDAADFVEQNDILFKILSTEH